MIKGLIFDLDGTLVNTASQLTGLCNHVMEKKGQPPVGEEVVISMLGEGPRRLMEKLYDYHRIDKGDLDEVFEEYQELYRASQADPEKIYPGITDLLETLKERGMFLGVNTNKPDEIARPMMEDFFPGIFDGVTGSGKQRPRKPDPYGTKELLDLGGIKPEEALYIGDTKVDIETGHAAGMKVIGVLWGFRSREELERAGADALISEPKEILKLL